MKRWFAGPLGAAIALTLLAANAGAHITMTSPPRRDDGLKDAPCGTANSVRGMTISTFSPGQTITIAWDETVPHPGYYRISFDDDGDDGFANPPNVGDFYSNPTVLLDNIADMDGTQSYTQEVMLPNIECDNCTLQLVQLMTDHGTYDPGPLGDDLYYQCVDLVLSAPGAGGGSSSASSSGSSGSGSGASTTGASGKGMTAGNGSAGTGPGAASDSEEDGVCSSSGAGRPASQGALWVIAAAGLMWLGRRRG